MDMQKKIYLKKGGRRHSMYDVHILSPVSGSQFQFHLPSKRRIRKYYLMFNKKIVESLNFT